MLLSGVLFVLFLGGCWLYCLTDAALTPTWEYLGRMRKNTWIYIIAATFIVGAVAWLIARRRWRTRFWLTAATRHPAGRSRQAPSGHGKLPKGPDDDLEFLRHLDRRIRGTSTDPGELSGPCRAAAGLAHRTRGLIFRSLLVAFSSSDHFWSFFGLLKRFKTTKNDRKMEGQPLGWCVSRLRES